MTDRFVVLVAVPYRRAVPTIESAHHAFFHGELLSGDDPQAYSRAADGPSPRIRKNVYIMPDLFNAGPTLICTKRVAEAIVTVADVQIVPARIEQAYSYAYSAGDLSCTAHLRMIFENDLVTIRESFVAAHACPVPEVDLYQIRPWRMIDVHDGAKASLRSIGIESDRSVGITKRVVRYSQSLLDQYGFLVDRGYVMREDVWNRLSGLVDPMYFWHNTFLV